MRLRVETEQRRIGHAECVTRNRANPRQARATSGSGLRDCAWGEPVRLSWGAGLAAPSLWAAAGLQHARAAVAPVSGPLHIPLIWFCLALFGAVLVAWRIRDRSLVRRQSELRGLVRQKTEQLEYLHCLVGTRNRVIEKLLSAEPLENVLETIASLTVDHAKSDASIPDACILIVKADAMPDAAICGSSPGVEGRFCLLGASAEIPEKWILAVRRPCGVPFEIWRQPCDYRDVPNDPAWREFMAGLSGDDAIPHGVRSLPIGDDGAGLGAILVFYREAPHGAPAEGSTGSRSWEGQLRVMAHMAQIAIEHRRFCAELSFRANHDTLTSLPNRNLFEERLQEALLEARRSDRKLAFLYLDMDGFKQINDCHGHRGGDRLLTEVARRMLAALEPGDTLARIGGDEFNAVLCNVDSADDAGRRATRVIEAVREPVRLNGHELIVTASVGIALYPDDGQDADDLRREADAAMYYAKSMGKNRSQSFSESATALDSVRLERDLQRALDEGWFVVHYQPKFTAEGRLAGIEALIRMDHPSHGRLLPGVFIPVAEASGLIVPIGAWVVVEVCRQIAEWRRRELAPIVVAVNVSAVQMACGDFAGLVEACLLAHAVPAHCLELEVTESMAVDRDGEVHRQMQRLRALGICISIDDFGTGFSSLSYLNRLQIDAVKLDRTFVQSIGTDGGAEHVVRAMIAAARGLGLDVIAEGVETEEQRTQLIALGCPVMQGYLFARPGPPETIELLLSRETTGTDLSQLCGATETVPTPVGAGSVV